ncbi:hypothetical protein SEA_ATUIN_60 [Arthrobacter phage Atuin]|nr:hypothetical protein SEA_ATUIN_159 [Arthrobacter phage Atuin]
MFKAFLDAMKASEKGIKEESHPQGDGTEPIHAIIRHDYKKAFDGSLWPQWHCKCGGSDSEPVGHFQSIEQAEENIRRSGAAHVLHANKVEETLRRTNGDFAF